MAHFQRQQIKLKIYAEMAEQEEIERERLHDEGYSHDEIERIMKEKRYAGFKKVHDKLPWDEKEKVVTGLHATNSGLPDTHHVKSTTKEGMEVMEKKY
mmetsp:Transcript_25882/g.22824  ORF Transcript_25882/g.22824 Transcript_25882/m.22824 type:complete len:98 (+) Transcript_25882:65-358(+)|eukprot:CAMPEP_0114588500 /NCGR_PEP_ID=MMETSP0125-20121206/11187_1 /TAXON_ID=485358 ORGANISM="Aristerostoma sp., Strain ATCC 50986" /NCGR_SAMPLE_ID=MMETSP0125 /ASSEMBLY_ACC=CAM_ASM_000245 /LENGTH=97 /DNA_ID=CAMNT_0001784927 /DNA_START=49 /DNA_END=342 /DNA_ORIENTATION=-